MWQIIFGDTTLEIIQTEMQVKKEKKHKTKRKTDNRNRDQRDG